MKPSSAPAFSDADAADKVVRKSEVKFPVIAAVTLGNALEMFDFTIFSFFAVMIGKQFFPATTPLASLLMTMATFGAGFVMRPLGGLVMGTYADRFGRKPAMMLCTSLMAVGTGMIGVTPSYDSIGVLAPLLIVTGRLLQGFSMGGEVGASTALLAEATLRSSRGFMISWQMASQGAAALVGALTGYLLSTFLSQQELDSWGWRLPFLFGLLLGPLGYAIRSMLHETPPIESRKGHAVRLVFSRFYHPLITGVLLMTGGTASMFIVVFYMPTYLVVGLHMPTSVSFLGACLAGAILLVGSPFAGLLSDRLARRKPFVIFSRLLGASLIYPAFWLLNHTAQPALALVAIGALAGCLTLGSGASFLLLVESFPQAVRATGFSLVYSIGVSIFGGFAPFVVTWLIEVSGDPMSPAHYMIVCSIVSLIALIPMKEHSTEPLGN